MKKNKMIRISALAILVFAMLAVSALNVFAEGNVTYAGQSEKFIFAPGSEYSPTDLFETYKNVLPGDVLTDKITVKNTADTTSTVKIYMRSKGSDEESQDFLSQLTLNAKYADRELFNETTDKPGQLAEWVELAQLAKGDEITLDLVLTVPADLDNKYQDCVGKLVWEFKIEEIPEETTTAKPAETTTTPSTTTGKTRTPATGDILDETGVIIVMAVSAAVIISMVVVLVYSNKNKKKNKNG